MEFFSSNSKFGGWALFAIGLLFAIGCTPRLATEVAVNDSGQYTDTLTVSPYLYVPRLQQFTDVMRVEWAKIHPETYLQIVTDWDCYSADPPDSIEVFVYDGIFFNYFLAQGYFSIIPESSISNPSDVIPYALKAGKRDGQLYSLPQIGCGNMLFYRDPVLNSANSIKDMFAAMGPATYSTVRPPDGQGLLIDFSGGTTDACYYVGTDMQVYDSYSSTTPPQPSCTGLHSKTLDSLQLLEIMAGKAQAAYSDTEPYMRAKWFGEGSGRAVVGFTEYLCFMGYDQDQVAFKPLPIGGATFTPFYVDLIGINSKTSTGMKTKAQELADLLSSEGYETASFGPDASGIPQYLMPIRWSVFDNLSPKFPLYAEMKAMVQKANPRAFLLDENARSWLENTKGCIRDSILRDTPLTFPGPKGKR